MCKNVAEDGDAWFDVLGSSVFSNDREIPRLYLIFISDSCLIRVIASISTYMEASKKGATNKTNDHYPPCKYLDLATKQWLDFKNFTLKAASTGEVIMRYTNRETTCKTTIEREIDYDFNASYARVLPTGLLGKQEVEPVMDEISKIPFPFATSPSSKKGPVQDQEEYPSLIIFKSLNRKRIVIDKTGFQKKREAIPVGDLYQIFGFKIKSNCYEECFDDLSRIKRKISQANFRLRYHDNGIKHQITQRIKYLTYKSMKQLLRTLAHMVGIPKDKPSCQTISALLELYEEPEIQQKIKSIAQQPAFIEEVKSIVYKSMISHGIFPSYVEINTMAEASVLLWMKKLLSNVVSAPWSSSYHASFSLGNHRYSFIYVPDDKSLQNKVNVSSDLRREFRSSTSKFDYFRLKFFDFFPMNSWVEQIAIFLTKTLSYFKILEEDDGLDFPKSTQTLNYKLGELMSAELFPQKIAEEFHIRYKDLFCKEVKHSKGIFNLGREMLSPQLRREKESVSSPLSAKNPEKHYDWVFLKLTELIADAEIRGYARFSNNCQTVVSEVVNLFCSNFQELVEPLLDMHTFVLAGNSAGYTKLQKNFNLYSSFFNQRFDIKVKPFALTHRLSYFGTYSDFDTYNLLKPENFERIKQLFQKYVKKPQVDSFLTTIKKSYWTHLEHFVDTMYEDKGKSGTKSKQVINDVSNDGATVLPSKEFYPLKSKSMGQPIEGSNALLIKGPTKSMVSEDNTQTDFPVQKGTAEESFSYLSHLVYILYNHLFTIRKKIKLKRDRVAELEEQLIKDRRRYSEAELLTESTGKTHKPKDTLKAKDKENKLKERDRLRKEIEPLYKEKYDVAMCYKEVCYYYYNSIRLGVLTKFNDTTSYIGFLLIKNPEYGSNKTLEQSESA